MGGWYRNTGKYPATAANELDGISGDASGNLSRCKKYLRSFQYFQRTARSFAPHSQMDIVDLIYNCVDGNAPDISTLSKEMQDYVKTVDVILGKTLYSDSWLEI